MSKSQEPKKSIDQVSPQPDDNAATVPPSSPVNSESEPETVPPKQASDEATVPPRQTREQSTLPPDAQVPSSSLTGNPDLDNHPRYRVIELLGSGGMGAVYKAEHKLMKRTVALKVINKELMTDHSVIERFGREVEAAARLHHPNIVTAHDAEQAGDVHFLVMEYVQGTDLKKAVEQRGRLTVDDACDYIRQAALGLQRAMKAGLVHRDIKPHNLIITPAGQVKILDFGLASLAATAASSDNAVTASDQVASASVTQAGVIMGTPDYLAPEQAQDAHSADIRADIYSLGCTLYFLLTGDVPFPGGTTIDKIMAHTDRTPRPVTDMRDDVPRALARLLNRMMAKTPADRPQTPIEVADTLSKIQSNLLPCPQYIKVASWMWIVWGTALITALIGGAVSTELSGLFYGLLIVPIAFIGEATQMLRGKRESLVSNGVGSMVIGLALALPGFFMLSLFMMRTNWRISSWFVIFAALAVSGLLLVISGVMIMLNDRKYRAWRHERKLG